MSHKPALHRSSKQFGQGVDGRGAYERNIGDNSVKCAGLQWIVQRECDRADRRSFVMQPDMTPFLADHLESKAFQCPDQPVG
jgi:hypothetical protein